MAEARSFKDVFEGRAYIHWSPVATLMLLHWAGAPWNDKVDDCHLSALQAEALMRPERETIVHGGSGVGKSVLGGGRGIRQAMTPIAKCFVIGSVYEHVAHEFSYLQRGMLSLFRGHQRAMVRMVCKDSAGHQDYECRTLWGARVRGMSTDSKEGASVLGNEASEIILAEGSQIKASILGRRIWRALDRYRMHDKNKKPRYTGRLSIFTTPNEHLGVSAAEFTRVRKAGRGDVGVFNCGRGIPWERTCWIREAESLENPAYDKGAVEAARKRAEETGEWAAFEEQYLGKMTYASGRIYTEYDPLRDAVPTPPPKDLYRMRFALGIDTGSHAAAVLLGLDQRNGLWALGEAYEIKVRLEVFAEAIQNMVVRVLGPVFQTDEWDELQKHIHDIYVDPATQVPLDIAHQLGVESVTPANRWEGKFELLETISQVRAFLASKRLQICEDLVDLNDQMERYIWKTVKVMGKDGITVKEPLKVDDHLLDAMRYGLIPLSQEEPLEDLPEPVTFEDAWKREQSQRIRDDLRSELDPNAGLSYESLMEIWS